MNCIILDLLMLPSIHAMKLVLKDYLELALIYIILVFAGLCIFFFHTILNVGFLYVSNWRLSIIGDTTNPGL